MTPQFQRDKPIYLQVVDQIMQEIVSGNRQAGDKLPSVRELAVDVGVNPNTIQRVYRELDIREVTITKRGQGTFVTEDKELIEQVRTDFKRRYIKQFFSDMEALGFSKAEIFQSLKEGEEDA
ncbi:GntR family transcriptional regulator [Gracilibacillus massiliensis]|uniref:GntR family transcriptional regulator n=1 Tax=Gracilibacillus massiliensis TaxID=1564956 RepID=UPI00071C83D9|nr:GntR family transcriptional regulator [Gracilibacillus massiliensis]